MLFGFKFKNKKNNNNKNLNLMIDLIEENIKKLDLLASEKDKKIIALKNELKENQKNEKFIISKILKCLDSIDEIRIFCERSNNIDMLNSINKTIKIIKNDLRNIGVEEIPTNGEIFNSNVHECIQTRNVQNKEHGEIIEVIRRGFYYNGIVIRTAIVITAQ